MKDPFIRLKHQLEDENLKTDAPLIENMTRDEAVAYAEADGTNTTESILKLKDEVKNG